MKKRLIVLITVLFTISILFTGCGSSTNSSPNTSKTSQETVQKQESSTESNVKKTDMSKAGAVEDTYQPKKDSYYFALTYKLIHPWYDAIKVGIDAAVAEYAEKGITIKYDWEAPALPDAVDQVQRIEALAAKNPDVIGVDITQNATTIPAINEVVDKGIPVMTFAGSDATKEDGCKRIAFVGNLDNEGDGAKLAEVLAKAINYEGEVACLEGTIGAPSHEQRIVGFNKVMAKYPNIKVVDRQRDNDELTKAVQITENFIQKHPNLKGIWCNNMTNPIGAAQAVVDAGKKGQIVIVGMDHDLRTLNYVKDGTILAAQVQNCYDMGYFFVRTAIKVADGLKPGPDTYPETYGVGSTTVYQDQAQKYIDLLYGNQDK